MSILGSLRQALTSNPVGNSGGLPCSNTKGTTVGHTHRIRPANGPDCPNWHRLAGRRPGPWSFEVLWRGQWFVVGQTSHGERSEPVPKMPKAAFEWMRDDLDDNDGIFLAGAAWSHSGDQPQQPRPPWPVLERCGGPSCGRAEIATSDVASGLWGRT
jgi:hypothetical protein